MSWLRIPVECFTWSLRDQNSFLEVTAEREFLNAIGAGCSTPVGALACVFEGKLYFNAEVLSPDGKKKIAVELNAQLDKAHDLGKKAAELAISKGARELLEKEKAT